MRQYFVCLGCKKEWDPGSAETSPAIGFDDGSNGDEIMRHDNVRFGFYSADDDYAELTGTVVVRGKEMVLDIDDRNGADRYLLAGNLVGQYYRARNGPHGIAVVEARWVRLADSFVGEWIEDGSLYLFRFRIPSKN